MIELVCLLFQGFFIRNPWVRKTLGIPTLEEMKRISQEVASANKVWPSLLPLCSIHQLASVQ